MMAKQLVKQRKLAQEVKLAALYYKQGGPVTVDTQDLLNSDQKFK